VRLRRLHEGAQAWDRYLRQFPNAQDAETFREQLRKVRQKLGSLN
jgi:regulator of sirC expression with transglutaminase-like and TPR domain